MRRLTVFLNVISLITAMAACTQDEINNEDEKNNPNELIEIGDATVLSCESVRITALVILPLKLGDAQFGVVCSLDPLPSNKNGLMRNGTELDDNNMYVVEFDGLIPGSKYYYASFVRNGLDIQYGEVKSFTTERFVDMGLSVKWSACNVGAPRPEDSGNYYAWGETEPYYEPGALNLVWKEGKTSGYSWTSYKWCDGDYNKLTKYNTSTSYGIVDNKTELDPEDDAARTYSGGKWRMPTHAEWTELIENCTWTWDFKKYTEGRWVTSNINGNSIFLPAAGFLLGSDLVGIGKGGDGLYWSSALYTDSPNIAWYVYFDNTEVAWYNYNPRCYGLPVRPVCE